jgi:hypothetical protein
MLLSVNVNIVYIRGESRLLIPDFFHYGPYTYAHPKNPRNHRSSGPKSSNIPKPRALCARFLAFKTQAKYQALKPVLAHKRTFEAYSTLQESHVPEYALAGLA